MRSKNRKMIKTKHGLYKWWRTYIEVGNFTRRILLNLSGERSRCCQDEEWIWLLKQIYIWLE
jgi:hypothetical protein